MNDKFFDGPDDLERFIFSDEPDEDSDLTDRIEIIADILGGLMREASVEQ